ncbi:MAG: AmmeMemoRadiSam system protein A [Puniceicoccales bacterium]|nr:AmmeMemoRadiSam system protein A [Puniceicoccales bacterium]
MDRVKFPNTAPPYVGEVKALLVPQASRRYCGAIASVSHGQIGKQHLERVFILTDNHCIGWLDRGIAIPNFDKFKVPNCEFSVDDSVCCALECHGPKIFSRRTDAFFENNITTQLPFLAKHAGPATVQLVPMIFQGTDPEERKEVAEFLAKQLRANDLLIISSDLSHYHLPANAAERYDNKTIGHLLSGTFPPGENCLCEPESTDCFLTLAQKMGWTAHFLAYGHSGHVDGFADEVVSYGAMAWSTAPMKLPVDALEALEDLALQTIHRRLHGDFPPDIGPLCRQFPQLHARQSVFVTLKKQGQLRGCIGSLGDFSNTIGAGIVQHAIDAAFHDDRFSPVIADEFSQLSAAVSILSFPRPLQLSPSQWVDHLGKTHPKPGVILEINGRRSTFLPEVWEVFPDGGAFLAALCEKQGSPAEAWRQQKNVRLLTYETQHSCGNRRDGGD